VDSRGGYSGGEYSGREYSGGVDAGGGVDSGIDGRRRGARLRFKIEKRTGADPSPET
jgi:hypothetical protein